MRKKIINIYNYFPDWVKNRYLISSILFCVWISIFDTNSLMVQLNQKKEINKIETDIKYYQEEIRKDEKIINIISQDSLTSELEKYLREKLFLSKDNEEIFIIE